MYVSSLLYHFDSQANVKEFVDAPMHFLR